MSLTIILTSTLDNQFRRQASARVWQQNWFEKRNDWRTVDQSIGNSANSSHERHARDDASNQRFLDFFLKRKSVEILVCFFCFLLVQMCSVAHRTGLEDGFKWIADTMYALLWILMVFLIFFFFWNSCDAELKPRYRSVNHIKIENTSKESKTIWLSRWMKKQKNDWICLFYFYFSSKTLKSTRIGYRGPKLLVTLFRITFWVNKFWSVIIIFVII